MLVLQALHRASGIGLLEARQHPVDNARPYSHELDAPLQFQTFLVTSRSCMAQAGACGLLKAHTNDCFVLLGRVKDLDFALDTARAILPAYERLFGMPYPLPKLDLVAIPDFAAGAMENWGLLMYRETALLAGQDSSIDALRGVAATIAHEMAHLVRLIRIHYLE
jgi:hypothetical protein